MKKIVTLTAAVLSIAAAAVTTEASAKGKHGVIIIGQHHHHHLRYWSYAPVYIAPRSCGWEYAKWQQTGSRYWKKEYYLCKGWW